MPLALYRKYRPQGWDEVVAQESVVRTLRNAVAAGRVAHAYLFAGPRGTGKTTLARLLAKAVNCLNADPNQRPDGYCDHCRAVAAGTFIDLIEIDAASNTGVDDVRELRDKINFSPTLGGYKVYIIDEVHMLSTPAFNALLKTLEEPPGHAIFVLATTELQKIPPTVLSRCQRFEFRRIPVDAIQANLAQIAAAEKLDIDEEALRLIARQATGSIRDAQSLLDQLSATSGRITVDKTQAVIGSALSKTVTDLLAAVLAGDGTAAFAMLRRSLDSGVDPRTLSRQLVDYLRGVVLARMKNADQVDAPLEAKLQMEEYASAIAMRDLLRYIRLFNVAATDSRTAWQPSLALELAIAEAVEHGPETTSSAPSQRPTAPAKPAPSGTPRRGDSEVKHQETPPAETEGLATADGELPKSVSAAEVARAWKDIAHSIAKTHGKLSALMNSVKLFDVQRGTLIVGFAGAVLAEQMDKVEYQDVVQRGLVDALGVRLRIRAVVTNARGKLPPDVPHDGMVAAALNTGGEIVDVQD